MNIFYLIITPLKNLFSLERIMTIIIQEITPLTQSGYLTFLKRVKLQLDFPMYTHEEFDLNLIMNANTVRRIVGDHSDIIDDLELVLVGSSLVQSSMPKYRNYGNYHSVSP